MSRHMGARHDNVKKSKYLFRFSKVKFMFNYLEVCDTSFYYPKCTRSKKVHDHCHRRQSKSTASSRSSHIMCVYEGEK